MTETNLPPLTPEFYGEGPAREACFHVVERWVECHNTPGDHPDHRQEFLHRQMNEEANVLENAASSLAEFPGADWSIRTDAQGSFHIYCYCDGNGNGEVDAGESRRVLNLALVGVEVTSLNAIPHPAELQQGEEDDCVITNNPSSNFVKVISGCFDFDLNSIAGMYLVASIRLRGGGADFKIGADKITLFFLQDFKGDSFTCSYGGGSTVKEVFACDPTIPSTICTGAPTLMSFPVLDNGNHNYPAGGFDPALTFNRSRNVGGDVTQRVIEALDSPAFRCDGFHPCANIETVSSTSGGNAFVAYITSFSAQAPHNYVCHARSDWTVTVAGAVARDETGNLIWTKDASSGITASSSTTGFPQAGSDVGIMVYGPGSTSAPSLKNDAR